MCGYDEDIAAVVPGRSHAYECTAPAPAAAAAAAAPTTRRADREGAGARQSAARSSTQMPNKEEVVDAALLTPEELASLKVRPTSEHTDYRRFLNDERGAVVVGLPCFSPRPMREECSPMITFDKLTELPKCVS